MIRRVVSLWWAKAVERMRSWFGTNTARTKPRITVSARVYRASTGRWENVDLRREGD